MTLSRKRESSHDHLPFLPLSIMRSQVISIIPGKGGFPLEINIIFAESGPMKPNIDVDSALHVLKGAVQKVLGATLTTSVFAEGNKGRLTVEFDRNPSDEEMERVLEEANLKIAENIPIEMFRMDRTEAEGRFGPIIYDKFPVPDHVKVLTLTRIEDWNINCCMGPHHQTTGEVPKISIRKWRHRPSRVELEISFGVG